MDNSLNYSAVLSDFLESYAADMNRGNLGITAKVLVDRERGHYQLLNNGWRNGKYYFYVVFHFDLIDGKIWIQENRTDILVAEELQTQGVPKKDIVLGLQSPEVRDYHGYAVG
jgi:hypothetical protein